MLKTMHFAWGWVTFGAYFGWKKTIPSNPRWTGKTRDIHVSYGVEILTDNYFILPQYTHLTDGQTDGQNCESNNVRCITRLQFTQLLSTADCHILWTKAQTQQHSTTHKNSIHPDCL